MQNPPSIPSLLAELLDLSSKAFLTAMAMSSSQAGPIVTSILAPSITKADTMLRKTYSPIPDIRSQNDWSKLWQRSTYLLASKNQTWPTSTVTLDISSTNLDEDQIFIIFSTPVQAII